MKESAYVKAGFVRGLVLHHMMIESVQPREFTVTMYQVFISAKLGDRAIFQHDNLIGDAAPEYAVEHELTDPLSGQSGNLIEQMNFRFNVQASNHAVRIVVQNRWPINLEELLDAERILERWENQTETQ